MRMLAPLIPRNDYDQSTPEVEAKFVMSACVKINISMIEPMNVIAPTT